MFQGLTMDGCWASLEKLDFADSITVDVILDFVSRLFTALKLKVSDTRDWWRHQDEMFL